MPRLPLLAAGPAALLVALLALLSLVALLALVAHRVRQPAQKRCEHPLYDRQFFIHVIKTLLHHLLVVQRRCCDRWWQTPIMVVAAVAAGLARGVSGFCSFSGQRPRQLPP